MALKRTLVTLSLAVSTLAGISACTNLGTSQRLSMMGGGDGILAYAPNNEDHGDVVQPSQQRLDEELVASARSGAESAVHEALRLGANVNGADSRGRTALYEAAERGCGYTATLLLQHGADAC